ncbi:hypothetical protein EDWATA_01023 [Edwardsiella tarda ATCC 23685]|uniref:Uncharacterized protein n=1 Tax=Edwardsiella tarda ATCC 23685 TaxID=500638 RepID=D4F2S2_EDWTA|nr:hypothetical protein EDWATA_01023 [Edwardsiella tarda ATCC 23685]
MSHDAHEARAGTDPSEDTSAARSLSCEKVAVYCLRVFIRKSGK